MRAANKKTIALLTCSVLFTLLPGCVNWEKRYDALSVEHENLKGLIERERSEKGLLADQVTQGQQTIEELQRQIEEQSKTPAQATLPNSILFGSGQATLMKATSTELNHIQSVLRQKYAGKPIDIVGHTDTDPIKKSKWKDNWELSAQRALTVARYLIQRGIAEDQIRAVGCGESRPIASNSNATGKAKNRRVEIVVNIRG
jgi:chemotaxis protein MotB